MREYGFRRDDRRLMSTQSQITGMSQLKVEDDGLFAWCFAWVAAISVKDYAFVGEPYSLVGGAIIQGSVALSVSCLSALGSSLSVRTFVRLGNCISVVGMLTCGSVGLL
jgi:hypothetical protein